MTTQREPVHLIECLKGLIRIVQAVGEPADQTRAPRGFDVSRRLLSEGEGFRQLSLPPHRQGAKISEVLRRNTIRVRSEEHTSELQSLMRISYAVFCLKNKKDTNKTTALTNIN